MLSFRLFGIPVAVRLSFLVIATLLGISAAQVSLIVIWVLIVFFSILIHELGHALTARGYGSEVEIELNALGGLTSWTMPEEGFGPGRRAAVAAAGSAVGVAFGALVWVFANLTGPHSGLVGFALTQLVYVNVFWGLLNWLPIRPLDGGHLLVSLLEKVSPSRAQAISNVVFLVTAAGGLAAALYFRLPFAALLCGWLLMGELTRGRAREPVPIPPMDFDRPAPTAEEQSEPGVDTEGEASKADG